MAVGGHPDLSGPLPSLEAAAVHSEGRTDQQAHESATANPVQGGPGLAPRKGGNGSVLAFPRPGRPCASSQAAAARRRGSGTKPRRRGARARRAGTPDWDRGLGRGIAARLGDAAAMASCPLLSGGVDPPA